MGIDTSKGYEVGVIDMAPFADMPKLKVVVVDEQLMVGSEAHPRGASPTAPERLAVEAIAAGRARAAPGATMSPRGEAYLHALTHQQETGVFDPQY
jgi:hypothetical protein